MPPPLMSKSEVVAHLYRVFRAFGYNGATLSRLSDASGLGKASLYHYFPGGKADMAAAVLDHVDAWLNQHVVTALREPGPPADRVNRMADQLNQLYAGGTQGCTLGNMALTGGRELFQDRLKATFHAWIEALTAVLREAGLPARLATERAEDAVLEIQGALVLSAALDSCHPFRRTLNDLPARLLARDHNRDSAA